MQFRNPLIGPEAIVVAMDMRSSSRMLDDLVIHSRLDPYVDLLTAMKHEIAASTLSLHCAPYKFTGDGWIVLFHTSTEGMAIYEFARRMSDCYRFESAKLLERLTVPLPAHGLIFGIDSGPILKKTIFQRPEYIGQAIVVACRLQAESKRLQASGYSAFVSSKFFGRYFSALSGLEVEHGSMRLGTLDEGTDVPYEKVRLL